MVSQFIAACGDNLFGPQVAEQCRSGFDFSLLFEETILATGPSALLLLSTPWRLAQLYKGRVKVSRTSFHAVKLIIIAAYSCLQLVLLILWSSSSVPTTKATITSASVNLVCSLAIGLLSHFEHSRSTRPSFILNFYLFASLLLDIVRARTQWLLSNNPSDISSVFTVAVVLKAVILVLEATEKRRLLLEAYRHFSSESTSGIFNRIMFWWLNRLLVKGSGKILSQEDLFSVDEALDSTSIGEALSLVWGKVKKEGNHALFFAVLQNFKWPILSIVVPRLAVVGLQLSQPFLVQEAISFVSAPDNQHTRDIGYGLIGAYAFVYVGNAIFTGLYQHQAYRAITMIRGGLIYMIYGKMIDLKIGNINESAAMTLMSTDVEQIANSLQFVNDIWANLIQVIFATWLLERQLGVACAAPLAIGILFSLGTLYFGRFIVPFQKRWLKAIQTRVNITSEALGVMKGVKFSGLTEKLTTIIQDLRSKELDISLPYRKLRVMNTVLSNLPGTINPVITFSVYALVQRSQSNGGALDISRAFTSLSILALLVYPCFGMIYAMPEINAAAGCFRRIQEYLVKESRQDHRIQASAATSSFKTTPQGGIELQDINVCYVKQDILVENGTFGWSTDSEPILQDINLRFNSPLNIIIGAVGSGKSTLLKALMGETPSSKGFVYVSSLEAAFCDQTSWIVNGTIKDNIVGASLYDHDWYTTVVEACALTLDLQLLPLSHLSLVGSKGITLSGGQRQRIAMARAIYARKRIAIFDDVLSGLDNATEEAVFSNVFGPDGLLKKTNTMAILVTHAAHRIPFADHIVVLADGRIVEQGSYDRLSTIGGYVSSLKLREPDKSQKSPSANITPIAFTADRVTVNKDKPSEDLTRQTGDLSIYRYYAESIGWWRFWLFVMYVSLNTVFQSIPTLWLNWWSGSSNPGANLGYWLGIYGLFAGLAGLFIWSACYQSSVVMVPISAKALHWTILKTAMKAPMSFFATTDTGITTNRFSQDMQLVDLTLPGALVNTSFQVGASISTAILTSIATKYLALTIPFIAIILFITQKFYLRTSRQLRLMDLEAKSPLYTHFIESLNGLVTIRAFGWSESSMKKNIQFLDASQKPYYLLFSIQRWLNLVLDMIVACIAIILISLAVTLKGKISPGFLGIAMVQVMDFGQTLSSLITYWTLLETSLGAIARVKSFAAETPSEDLPGEDQSPPESWPQAGCVEFKDITASYSKTSPPVLNQVSFSIAKGEKIGIVGRTGSGKSSLLLTLFRMLDLDSGTITVDNVDISKLPRQDLRANLIALPQDPFFLNGTVRLNADPMEMCEDREIEVALRKVGLWGVIVEKGGLGADMHAEFLSHGQRQLFCLARAMLRKSAILVLDEATSSVDSKTDQTMQKLIREEFEGYTIIAVAHRLDSLMDFDKIAVLDQGRLVDFDSLSRLLERPSIFRDLYHA